MLTPMWGKCYGDKGDFLQQLLFTMIVTVRYEGPIPCNKILV